MLITAETNLRLLAYFSHASTKLLMGEYHYVVWSILGLLELLQSLRVVAILQFFCEKLYDCARFQLTRLNNPNSRAQSWSTPTLIIYHSVCTRPGSDTPTTAATSEAIELAVFISTRMLL
jgi:hypothetical protein